uniref:Cysteine-rich DPF motif domain-containing protein 1 n=1 Tax=Heterorhabditis bacteriophora TaxID=37862 RepID=A0A1I7XRD8_HETBA
MVTAAILYSVVLSVYVSRSAIKLRINQRAQFPNMVFNISKEDMRNLDPFISFECCICKLNEKCLFGELKASDGYYASPMFFIRDPFAPPTRIRTRKPILSDFLVMGSCCSICSRSVCIDKACCIYFGAFFCADCIVRERRRFPEKVLEMLTKAQHSSDKSETS